MRMTMRMLWIAALTASLIAALPLMADDDDAAHRGEASRNYPPLDVPAAALSHPDDNFARLSQRIANGTANVIERRAWYELRKRYFPFTPDNMPPRDWQIRATEVGLEPAPPTVRPAVSTAIGPRLFAPNASPLVPANYTWTHLGGTDYCVGDPPAAGCPDKGTGRGTAIWVNPNNKNQLLVGFAGGGVWKTLDQGVTWTPLFDNQATLSIGSIAAVVGPSLNLDNTTTIYVATGEGNFGQDNTQGVGVLKSTDGGATWTTQSIPWVVAPDLTSMAPNSTSIRRIVVDPNNAQKLWIAADSGVYRTTNGGTTWSLVSTLPYYKKFAGDCWGVYWSDIMLDNTTNPSTIYAAGARPFDSGCSAIAREDNGVYRSTDDGTSWTNVTVPAANCPGTVAGTTSRGYTCAGSGFAASGLTNSTTINGTVGRLTLMRSNSNKQALFVLVHNTATDQNLGIWKTVNSAATPTVTWTAGPGTATAWASQGWYALSGAVDPTSTSRAIVGGLDTYCWDTTTTTLNKTSSWTGWGTANYAHADHHHFVWFDATTIYLVNDGGFYVGTVGAGFPAANSITWVGRNRGGIDTLQLYGIGQDSAVAYQMHGGLQDNGELQSVVTGGVITGWNQAAGGDGGFSATDQTTSTNTYEEYVYAIMAKSTNSGASYASCFRNFGTCTSVANRCSGNCIPDNATEFIAPMELDANTQTTIYTGSRFVYRNNAAGGTTWTAISPDLTTTNNANDITHIESAPNNATPGTIWAGTINGKIWISTNATTATASPTWTNRTAANLPVRAVTWIATDPTNGQKAVASFSGFNTGHVFRTTDGGATWTDISGSLPNEPFESVIINPANTAQGFTGSDTGVFVNDDIWNSTTWTRINNSLLPNVRANELQFTTPLRGMMRVATHGRGFWETCTLVSAAPTGVAAAANGNGRIDVTWTTNGSQRYRIFRSTTNGGPYSLVGTSATGTFSDTTVAQNTTYFYVVRGNDCSDSVNSAEAFATSSCDAAPSAVTGLALSAPAGVCTINLTWNASTSSCSGTITYNVYRGLAGFTPGPASRVASGLTTTSYSDSGGLAAGTTYQYIVRAFDSRSQSEESNTTRVSLTPAAGCTTGPSMLQVVTVRATNGANKIEWVAPAAGSSLQAKICFSTTAFPTTPATCTAVPGTPVAIVAGAKSSVVHSALTNGTKYYYSAYVQNGTNFSPAINVSATPQVTAANLKWIYNTTASVLSPPGIGSVFSSGNDRILHSINPGASGGDWPAAWTPALLNAPAQARPPVPSIPGLGTGKQVYLGSQDGNVFCYDGNNGAKIWGTAAPIGSMVQGAANGMFTAYGGAFNLTLVGTRNATSDNTFVGLNALTGAAAWTFNNGGGANGIGVITSDAWVDYATNRVYFTSRAKQGGTTATAWCLSFNGTSASKVWAVPIGDADGSPTLWNNRLYVGNNAGVVYALDPSNGATLWSYATSDGPVKGFVNPDWNGTNALYFTTTNKVWKVTDGGSSATLAWSVNVTAPSIPLFIGAQLLVGSGDGKLYELSNLNNAAPTTKSIDLSGGTAAIGSPSFDFGNGMAYAGSDAGSIYAVSIPLP